MHDNSIKVLLINGSPKPQGCTSRALAEIETTLHECGVETERIEAGVKDVRGCR